MNNVVMGEASTAHSIENMVESCTAAPEAMAIATPIENETLPPEPPPPPATDAVVVQTTATAVPAVTTSSANALNSSTRIPKEPKTGYNYFCDMRRPQLLVECPDAKPAEISKMLGEGWKHLDTAELRAPYEAQAAADRARFAAECAQLGIDPQHRHKRKSVGDGTSGQLSLGRSGSGYAVTEAVVSRPAPALSAVDFYTIASAARYVSGSTSTARFDALPPEEREGYEAAARADLLRYLREKLEVEAEAARAANGEMGAEGGSANGAPIELIAVAVDGGAGFEGGGGSHLQATLAPPPARAPYKKFKPKTRKPTEPEAAVLAAIDRVKHAGREAEEIVEGWSLKLVADPTGNGKLDLHLTAPDGAVLHTAMDVKRKFGMVLQEAAEARAASKGLGLPYHAAAAAPALHHNGGAAAAAAVAAATAVTVSAPEVTEEPAAAVAVDATEVPSYSMEAAASAVAVAAPEAPHEAPAVSEPMFDLHPPGTAQIQPVATEEAGLHDVVEQPQSANQNLEADGCSASVTPSEHYSSIAEHLASQANQGAPLM